MARWLSIWVLILVAISGCREPEELPRFGDVPAFTLTDHEGRSVSLATLRGKVWVVDFIFTSCPDVCPLLTEQLGRVRSQLPKGKELGFLSLSVDPEHDTPQKLKAFAVAHGANVPDWLFLTGKLDEIKRVVTRGFKQAMDAQPVLAGRLPNVLHGTHYVLIDRGATIRGYFRSDEDGIAELSQATQTLLSQGDRR